MHAGSSILDILNNGHFVSICSADIVPSPLLTQPVGICLPGGHRFPVDNY